MKLSYNGVISVCAWTGSSQSVHITRLDSA